MIMTTTLQSVIQKDPNSGDLSPLASNETFTTAVNAELAATEAAAATAQAHADKQEDTISVVRLFSGVMSGLRNVAKRFPEAATHIEEAVKKVQSAMGVVKNNPVKPAATGLFAPATPGVSPAPAAPVSVVGTPVPASQPTSKPYTDPATGAIWRFNGIAWVKTEPTPVVKK
jgi:hypothetical protein